jgi:hypothetical protein
MRYVRALALLVTVSLATAIPAQATGFGINAHIPSSAISDRIENAGIEWVRIDFLWSFVEPEKDVYDWTVYDALVDRLEARGLKIYSTLGSTPAWATGGSESSGVPEDPNQWREVCYLAAHRYAGRIEAWGLWNEPNLVRFWEGNRWEYIYEILLPGAEAIALADPTALICAPDLAHLSSADWDDWLRDSVRAAIDLLDVVTHHVYPSNARAWEVTYDLETGGPFPWSPPSVQEVLQEAGWWRRPFWLTETGVESARWGEATQADFVDDHLHTWYDPDRAHRDWVDRTFFYEMNDGPSPTPYTWGLLHGPPDLVPKPAYATYAAYIETATVDDAELVTTTIPTYFQPGQPATAWVTFRNTGTTQWSRDQPILLSAVIEAQGWVLEVEQLGDGETVDPGEDRRFRVNITAPTDSGPSGRDETLIWARMDRESMWAFGDLLRHALVVSDTRPPTIVVQPRAAWVAPGAWTTLRVQAVGPGDLSYRWFRNGIELGDNDLYSGSTTSELTVNALAPEVLAVYLCEVTNEAGPVLSETAEIRNAAPRSGGSGRAVPDPAVAGGPVRVQDLRYSGPPIRR